MRNLPVDRGVDLVHPNDGRGRDSGRLWARFCRSGAWLEIGYRANIRRVRLYCYILGLGDDRGYTTG